MGTDQGEAPWLTERKERYGVLKKQVGRKGQDRARVASSKQKAEPGLRRAQARHMPDVRRANRGVSLVRVEAARTELHVVG